MAAASMTDEVLICEVVQSVATITFNRPAQLNAIDAALGEAFDATVVRLAYDPDVRAVVVTGAGRAFCAGVDAGDLAGIAGSGGRSFNGPAPGDPSPVFDGLPNAPAEYKIRAQVLRALPQPVIAAINGPCAGIGLAIALASDVRFAAPEAMLTTIFARRGLTAESGLAWTLPRIVGEGAAADMLLSARKVGAEEAYRMRLVDRLTASGKVVEDAVAYAKDIARNVSPRATRVIKQQLMAARDQTFGEALRRAYAEVIDSLGSEDFKEGVAHFRERRDPQFTGR